MSTQQVKASLGYTRSYLKKKKVKKGKERKKKGRRKSELEVTEILSKVPSQSPAVGLALWAALVEPGEYGGLWQTTSSQPGLGARSAGEATTLRKVGTGEGSVIPG